MNDEKRDQIMLETLDRLARIETKLDGHHETRRVADDAHDMASTALHKAEDNARDIEGIRKTTQWAIGVAASFAVGLGGVLVAILFK